MTSLDSAYTALPTGAQLSFSHFVAIEYQPSVRSMQFFFNRGAAIMLKGCAEAADFILPLRVANEYGGLLVQVKKWAGSTRFGDARELRGSVVVKDCTVRQQRLFPGLLLQLGGSPSKGQFAFTRYVRKRFSLSQSFVDTTRPINSKQQ